MRQARSDSRGQQPRIGHHVARGGEHALTVLAKLGQPVAERLVLQLPLLALLR